MPASARRLTAVQLDRAAGVLVAAAVGDALGAGYEFQAPCPAETVKMLPGALTRRPAGSWTDDTDMAMAIAQVGATGVRLDEGEGLGAVAARFADWYASHPPTSGTRRARSFPRRRWDRQMPNAMQAAAEAYQDRHPNAAGNGSLMRTGPVALTGLGDDERILASASAISALTHPHALARQACQIWCIAIDRAIREGRLDGIHDGLALIEPDGHGYWHDAIAQAETLPVEPMLKVRSVRPWPSAATPTRWRPSPERSLVLATGPARCPSSGGAACPDGRRNSATAIWSRWPSLPSAVARRTRQVGPQKAISCPTTNVPTTPSGWLEPWPGTTVSFGVTWQA
jgi:hypothetical protein